jgi:hypothetical protein
MANVQQGLLLLLLLLRGMVVHRPASYRQVVVSLHNPASSVFVLPSRPQHVQLQSTMCFTW